MKKNNTVDKIEKFKDQMINELQNNSHKGDITDFKDFYQIVAELEYHKAKLLIAIRVNNKHAIKEYIADVANYLFALGNLGGLYDDDFVDLEENYSMEVNKDVDVFIKTNDPQKNQTLGLK